MSETNKSIRPATREILLFYRRWTEMRYRCSRPNHKLYKWYGARGITVCDRWQTFDAFYADMYPSFTDGMQLDRIDNSSGYSPENCRWVTSKQNNRNRRSNRVVETPQGAMVLSVAAERFGIPAGVLWHRLKVGMPQERVFLAADLRVVK